MSIPQPNKDEEQQQFISRCMSNDVMKQDYPDNDKRLAVCFDAWRKAKEESKKFDKKGREIVAENVQMIIRGTINEDQK